MKKCKHTNGDEFALTLLGFAGFSKEIAVFHCENCEDKVVLPFEPWSI